MSTHFEAHHAGFTTISGAIPGVTIGDDVLDDGDYAILVTSDEVSYIYGTVEQLEKIGAAFQKTLGLIREHAAKATADGA